MLALTLLLLVMIVLSLLSLFDWRDAALLSASSCMTSIYGFISNALRSSLYWLLFLTILMENIKSIDTRKAVYVGRIYELGVLITWGSQWRGSRHFVACTYDVTDYIQLDGFYMLTFSTKRTKHIWRFTLFGFFLFWADASA